jgi:hypothetical protein
VPTFRQNFLQFHCFGLLVWVPWRSRSLLELPSDNCSPKLQLTSVNNAIAIAQLLHKLLPHSITLSIHSRFPLPTTNSDRDRKPTHPPENSHSNPQNFTPILTRSPDELDPLFSQFYLPYDPYISPLHLLDSSPSFPESF